MRIAIASWESLHSISVGGVAVHVSELARAMEANGHDVHVFTRQGPGQTEDERIQGVWYHRVAFSPYPDFVDGIYGMCHAIARRFGETQRLTGPFDIFHGHDWLAVPALLEVKRVYGTTTVVTMHSTEYGRCGNNFYDGPSSRIRRLEHLGVEEADRVITVSRTLQREISWMFETPAEDMAVIYNGVRPSPLRHANEGKKVRRRYELDRDAPLILFAGRMTCQKGPDLLLGAVPEILRQTPEARFVFAGEGDLRPRLEAESGHRGISHACRFLGHQSSTVLKDLYSAADLVVVPSRNEPFGIVILEAWNAARPVVATENGGPSEFVWHEVTGLKIRDREESIAWGVKRVLQNPTWGSWMGRNGRVAVETAFCWESIGRKTEQLYLDLLRPRSLDGMAELAPA